MRGQRETVPGGNNRGDFRPRGLMTHVFYNFDGDQESGIHAVNHRRSFSISSNKSSSALNGRITAPRLTGAMSSTLCGDTLLGRRLLTRSESQSNKLSCWSGDRASAAPSISVNVDIDLLYAKPEPFSTVFLTETDALRLDGVWRYLFELLLVDMNHFGGGEAVEPGGGGVAVGPDGLAINQVVQLQIRQILGE